MIKVLLLDVDGVIVNARRFSETLEKDYGLTEEDTLLFFKGKFLDCLIGKADLYEELLPHLKEWGWAKSVDEFVEYWFTSEHKIDEQLMDYVGELRKKGIKCYIVTNQEKYRTEYLLSEMNFDTLFDGIFSSAHIGFRKPREDFFLYVLRRLKGIKRDEIVLWDNTPEHIESARQLGIHAELYKGFDTFREKMKNYP
ncbi:HAD-IA family hydrolase [Candidatus Roizmanbacteria bacterium]|nr:HAD-IA family hydrolase [Candidatus Roizmanbacteria bacterium]